MTSPSSPPSRPATPPSEGLLRPSQVPTPRGGPTHSSSARGTGELGLPVAGTGSNSGHRMAGGLASPYHHSPTPSYSSSMSYPSATDIHISSYYFGNMDALSTSDVGARTEADWLSASASASASGNESNLSASTTMSGPLGQPPGEAAPRMELHPISLDPPVTIPEVIATNTAGTTSTLATGTSGRRAHQEWNASVFADNSRDARQAADPMSSRGLSPERTPMERSAFNWQPQQQQLQQQALPDTPDGAETPRTNVPSHQQSYGYRDNLEPHHLSSQTAIPIVEGPLLADADIPIPGPSRFSESPPNAGPSQMPALGRIPSASTTGTGSQPIMGARFVDEPLDWNVDEEEGRANLTGEPGRLLRKDSAEVIAAAGGGALGPHHHLGATGGALAGGASRVSKSLRRLSRRIVNLEGRTTAGLQGGAGAHVRLPPEADDVAEKDQESDDEDQLMVIEDITKGGQVPHAQVGNQMLRGRTLGCLSPTNPLRKACARLLDNWWIEPFILTMIVVNVVVLVLQSSRSVFSHPRRPGYFDYWEDYALLGVFGVFTVEVLCRIIVSGLLINPPPMYLPEAVRTDSPPPEGASVNRGSAMTMHSDPSKKAAFESNTLNTFSQLGDSLKKTAERALRVDPFDSERPEIYERSPNRVTFPKRPFEYADARLDSSDTITSVGRDGAPSMTPAGRPAFQTHARVGSGRQHIHGKMTDRRQATLDSANALAERKGTLPLDPAVPFVEAIMTQRAQAAHYAYLRHSWNRVDLVAVIAFWVTFLLCIFKAENTDSYHIYIFRALSVLRAARLLTITTGTTTILQSLKLAAPLLVNVTFFIVFFMILFSIIGVQSFKGSYRRSCVWLGIGADQQPGTNYTLSQICGGFYDAAGQAHGHLNTDLSPSGAGAKGFMCPNGQVCVEQSSNPMSGVQSFDNIVASLLQIVIIISSNGWSQTMYDMIDADYFVSCLFFIISLIMMNFWMANLFVAVITNTFATITAETKQSAFANQKIVTEPKPVDEKQQRRRRVADVYKRIWSWTKIIWLAAIVADLGTQAARTQYDSPATVRKYDNAELWFTVAFDVEIIFRFFAFLLDNDWRSFLAHRRNIVDFGLAVITSISQIPVIKTSGVYPWLTGFQVARFYRVIAAVPRMEALLYRVFGSMAGLFNMIMFLLLMVGLAALIAVQLFRGDIPAEDDDGTQIEMTFKQMYNSYLAMYQIFSSENWTDVLWHSLIYELPFKQTVFAGVFISGWFLFANFIVLQMFIAVINENFGVAEGQKRQQQLEAFLKRNEAPAPSTTQKILNIVSPYRVLRRRNAKILGGEKEARREEADNQINEKHKRQRSLQTLMDASLASKSVNAMKRMLRLDKPEEPVPLDTLRARQFRQSLSGAEVLAAPGSMRNLMSVYEGPRADEAGRLYARDRQLDRMRTDLGLGRGGGMTQAEVDAAYRARANDPRVEAARFLNSHPSYDKSLWLFSNMSPIRRFCQSLHPPSYGERIFGRQASRVRNAIFRISIFLAIVGSVVVAGIATPAYRRSWYQENGLRRDSWFSLVEVLLSVFFLFEFVVKVIADGFAFTPNAFLLSVWNALDLFVLITLLINVSTEMAVIGGVSRFTRALKAFRALRLINIIPYAVWGQRLFAGLLYSCSDGSAGILNKGDCVGEYAASPSQWEFLAPRVWANPTEGSVYSFDDFKSSLLILFEIVSLEGWIDVMQAAMRIAGKDQQPQPDNRQINAMFFVIYNLVGAVFVLTLFVSVIIENFQTFSGAAFQTTEQRQWLDLKKLIYRQRPAKRPRQKPTAGARAWCYERAVQKTGWWSRGVTIVYILNIIVLMTQRFGDPQWVDRLREILYLAFTIIYSVDIGVRLYGLGVRSFIESWWNLYDLAVVLGTLATTIPLLRAGVGSQVNVQFQKIFLTGIAFKLVQKSDSLNQLFKLAIASLPAILNLFLLWLTFFLVFAIMLVEVFGLTKWGPNETYSKNFSTLIGSMVFLSMMSTGEGWNTYMHDYTLDSPACTPSLNYLDTDCGSTAWAYGLFIGWNVVSMYIFLNMFTGTVVENFSYIFQVGGKMSLSRAQMRGFKKSWAQYDPSRTGYMTRDKFVPFFRSLSGVFDVKAYPADGTVQALLKVASGSNFPSSPGKSNSALSPFARLRGASPGATSPTKSSPDRSAFKWPPSPSSPKSMVIEGVDVKKLRQTLSSFNTADIRRRKDRFNRLYHDAVLQDEDGKGISFTNMLILLARYKLIDESQALEVEELIERRLQMERVDDSINLERVRGVMRMVYLRHRFLAIRAAARSTLDVPGGRGQSHVLPTDNAFDYVPPQRRAGDAEGPNGPGRQGSTPIPTIVLDPAPPSRKPTLSLDLSAISNINATGSAEAASRGAGGFSDRQEGEGATLPASRSAQAILYQQAGARSSADNTSREQLVSTATDAEVEEMLHSPGDVSQAETAQPFDSRRLSPQTSPSLDEIGRRASPRLQEFQQSRWGQAMRRLSRLSHDVDNSLQFDFDRDQPGEADREREREWGEHGHSTASWRRSRVGSGIGLGMPSFSASGAGGASRPNSGTPSGNWTIRGVTRSWFSRGSDEAHAGSYHQQPSAEHTGLSTPPSRRATASGSDTPAEGERGDESGSHSQQGSFYVLEGHQPRARSRSSGYWPAF
ncbi:calcium channel protein [Tilletia horrida]|nr:calcium channel protein [Tilletia horrida]